MRFHLIERLAHEQSYRGSVVIGLELVVDRHHVRAELSHVAGVEIGHLDLQNHVAAKAYVVEEHVNELLPAADCQAVLAPNEREARPQLQQELRDVVHERVFEFALIVTLAHGEEVEVVRILGNLLREVALWGGQRGGEVGDRLSLTLVEVRVEEVQ